MPGTLERASKIQTSSVGKPLLEEDDVRLHAGAVGREGPARQAQDRMQVAVLHEDFEDLAGLVFEEAVVRQDDAARPPSFRMFMHVLDEVELLVRLFRW